MLLCESIIGVYQTLNIAREVLLFLFLPYSHISIIKDSFLSQDQYNLPLHKRFNYMLTIEVHLTPKYFFA